MDDHLIMQHKMKLMIMIMKEWFIIITNMYSSHDNLNSHNIDKF